MKTTSTSTFEKSGAKHTSTFSPPYPPLRKVEPNIFGKSGANSTPTFSEGLALTSLQLFLKVDLD